MENGYAAPVVVSFTTRADMLETIAGFTTKRVRRELAYAQRAGVPIADADELRWLAALAVRLLEELAPARERLEELRAAIRAENISYGEIAELQGLAEHIAPDDVELLEWAGVPEYQTETVSVEYAVTLGVSEDSPAPTEDDVRDAILRRATDDGLSIVTIKVERA